MRTKEEIMSDAADKRLTQGIRFETLAEKHSYLLVEIACDRRDEEIAHYNRIEERMNYAWRKPGEGR